MVGASSWWFGLSLDKIIEGAKAFMTGSQKGSTVSLRPQPKSWEELLEATEMLLHHDNRLVMWRDTSIPKTILCEECRRLTYTKGAWYPDGFMPSILCVSDDPVSGDCVWCETKWERGE